MASRSSRSRWSPKGDGSLGSCDMPLYEPICNRVEVVRAVFGGVTEELV
jgi:hypothetical protein